jgi:hypothetical protein
MKNGRAKKMGWKDPPIRDKHETIHFAPDAIQACIGQSNQSRILA